MRRAPGDSPATSRRSFLPETDDAFSPDSPPGGISSSAFLFLSARKSGFVPGGACRARPGYASLNL